MPASSAKTPQPLTCNTTVFAPDSRLLAPVLAKALYARGMSETDARQMAREYQQQIPQWTEGTFPRIRYNS